MLKRPCLVCWWRAIQTKGRGERRPWRLWLKDGRERERASENLKNYYFPFYLFGNTNFGIWLSKEKYVRNDGCDDDRNNFGPILIERFDCRLVQKAQRNAVRFFDPSHLFISLNFDHLDVYGSLVWGLFFLCWNAWWWCDCCGCRSDIPVGGTDGERKRERNIKGGQNTREI